MSHDAWWHINTHPIELPSNKVIGEQAAWHVFSNLVAHASNDKGLVWVSDRTQENETGLLRRNIREARKLFEEQGLLVDTGKRKEKGVKVFQLVIPGFQFSSGLDITPTEQQTSGLGSGLASGLGSGLASGLGSGLASGLDITPQTEHKEIEINPSKIKLGDDGKSLFIKALRCELEHRPSDIPEAVLAKSKRDYWAPFIREVLDLYPGSENDRDAVTYFLSLVNPDDFRFRCSASTLAALNDRYTNNLAEAKF
jgi:hypothetical protein